MSCPGCGCCGYYGFETKPRKEPEPVVEVVDLNVISPSSMQKLGLFTPSYKSLPSNSPIHITKRKEKRSVASYVVNQSQRHDLPFPAIKSRLVTSIILGFNGCRNMVVSLSIRLSKSSRAFIISQNCLPGFIFQKHHNITSWLYEFKMSEKFRKSLEVQISQEHAENIVN